MRDLDNLSILGVNLILGCLIGMFVFGAVVLWALGILVTICVIVSFFVMMFNKDAG